MIAKRTAGKINYAIEISAMQFRLLFVFTQSLFIQLFQTFEHIVVVTTLAQH